MPSRMSPRKNRLRAYQKACPSCGRITHADLKHCPACNTPWRQRFNPGLLLVTLFVALFLFVLVPAMTSTNRSLRSPAPSSFER